MKRILLISLVLWLGAFAASSWGVCPEEPNDLGECDTMHIEPWGPDVDTLKQAPGGPYFVRVPVYVTCDAADAEDSIAGFVIPLCYEQKTNMSKYARVTTDYNNTNLWPFPGLEQSIFRNIAKSPGDSIFNWMMLQAYDFPGEWDTRILELDGVSHFWLGMFATGIPGDHLFGEGYKILIVTMTFELEDTMTVCVDTCYWPPGSALSFTVIGHGSMMKIPRSGTGTGSFEVCFGPSVSYVREIGDFEEGRPTEFSLSQNYPNPFNPVTNFRFTLAKSRHVKIEIFNIVGQRVRTLLDEVMKPGVYLADWDGKDEKGNSVSSGIYFYRMQAEDFSDMKKMLLMK